MKLSASEAAALFKRPPPTVRLVLLYGPDAGLVAERAVALADAVTGGATADPCRVALLDGAALAKDPARLADEAAQLSLLGGRRVIRLRDVSDTIAKLLAPILSGTAADALIVIEAGELGRSSALRKLAETHAATAAIACYEDGPRELGQLLRDATRPHRIQLTDDAVAYLTAHLGANRQLSRQEIEKLVIYAGDGGTIGLAEAASLVGDSSRLDLDDVVYAAFDRDREGASAGLDRLFLAGEQPVTILRAAQRHGQRLHLAAARLAGGESLDRAVQAQHLFFKLVPRFRAQLERWRLPQLSAALRQLTKAELDCKSTGYPDQTRCRQALMMLGDAAF